MSPQIAPSVEKEKGHAGLSLGWRNEFFDDRERTPELRWPESVQVYDQMRRTESKLQGVERALNLPILRSSFRIRPNSARDEVVERLSRNLGLPIEGAEDDLPQQTVRRRDRFSLLDHFRHALLELPFGHMAFEQVYVIEDDGFARIRKLAPRMPQTIAAIKVAADGGLEGIEQYPQATTGPNIKISTERPFISIDRLVWYATNREGGDWTGRSVYRPIYRNWFLRNRFYRVDAMTKERNGMGVPVLERTIPQLPTEEERIAAENFATQFRAGEFAGGQVPYGYRLRLVGVEGAVADALESAKHHGEEISTSVLQGFLDLGKTETGSRALGETFVDFFMQTENAVLVDLLDVFNTHVVEDWVDVNWGSNEPAPEVIAPEIGTETAPTGEALARLIEIGALAPDQSLRAFLRRTYRLPEEDDPENSPVPPEPVEAARKRREKLRAAAGPTFRRQLFEHELRAKTDFTTLQGTWQSALDRLLDDFKGVRDAQIDSLLEQVRELVDADDVAALGALSVEVADATTLLEERMTEIAEEAREEAIAEAGRQGRDIDLPDLDTDSISEHATRISMLMGQDLATVVGRKAGENATLSGIDAAARVREHLDSLSDTYLTDNLGGALTTAQNTARLAVMNEGEPSEIYSSELLDNVTCENCADIDGKQYVGLDDAQNDYPAGYFHACLGGSRCRGTLVAIYAEAEPTVS